MPRKRFAFGGKVSVVKKGAMVKEVQKNAVLSGEEYANGGTYGSIVTTRSANMTDKYKNDAAEKIIDGHEGATIREPPTHSILNTSLGVGTKAGNDVVLSNLVDCTVSLCAVMNGLRIDCLQRCHVYAGPVAGSVFVDECTDCVFVIASRQIRIHHTLNTDFYVHPQSGPIIEDCEGLRFAPYGLTYPHLSDHYSTSGLLRSRNKWNDVKDFKWLRAQHSPNWSELPEAERMVVTRDPDFVQTTTFSGISRTLARPEVSNVAEVHSNGTDRNGDVTNDDSEEEL